MKFKLPVGWEVYTAEEALDQIIDYRGRTPKKSEIGIPTLSARSVKNNYIDFSKVYYISEEEYNDFMTRGFPEIGDVVLTTEAPLGLVTQLQTDKIALAQRILTVRGKRELIINSYLKYYFQSTVGQHELQSRATGTTVVGISQKHFRKCKLILPSLNEQRVIANTLLCIDNKIELNNKINKNLEEQAQAIFKRWFVDFEFPDENGNPYKSNGGEMIESELGMIPKGWEVCTLDEIANITMGQSPKGTTYNELGEGVVFYQGRTDFTGRFPERRLYTTDPKRIASRGDILMSVRAPVGDINIANEDCCIGRGLCSLNSKGNMNSYLLYTLLKLKDQYNIYNGEGTVFGSINQKELKGLKIVKPIEILIEKYDKLVSSMDRKYWVLDKENRALTKLRDALLPKLMSGELRIPLD